MPAFFMSFMTEEIVSSLHTEIEERLAVAEPDVELLLAEVSGPTLRVFIDHPGGVTLALCERVSGRLGDYRDRYSLEVSSPGQDRPLTKPQHYSRFLGRSLQMLGRHAEARKPLALAACLQPGRPDYRLYRDRARAAAARA